MARDYPRIGSATKQKKWEKLTDKQAKNIPCRVCGARATHLVTVEVNWFRGDDEGRFKACPIHKDDARALLDPPAKEVAHG